MSIGSFTIIKNEKEWIGPHLLSWLPYLDEMVFFDGNSTDGTLEIIDFIKRTHEFGRKIILTKNRDPIDLGDDYVTLFNECMSSLSTDYGNFLHPDMILVDSGQIRNLHDAIAYTTHLTSFAGEPGGQLYSVSGRAEQWKNIYRLRNPDLGAHYFGWYGAQNEDVYFSEITGDSHEHYGDIFTAYPYEVKDSGIWVNHYSDVRPYSRRLERMKTCLRHQGHEERNIESMAKNHPRVSLENTGGFTFEPATYPPVFREFQEMWERALVRGT